jgi:hypothetical protein
MIRRLIAVGTVAALSLVASASSAADTGTGSFGQQGQFIISADRLFALFAYTNNKVSPDNVSNADLTISGTSVGIIGGNSAVGLGGGGTSLGATNGTFYNVPRFGFDYSVINNLTVGGEAIVFFSLGGSAHQNPNSNSTDLPSGNILGIAPRVGYVLGINDLLSFWLRGGLHFYAAQVNSVGGMAGCTPPSSTAHVFGLDINPQLIITPAQHFGIMVGPTFDWGFVGGASTPAGCSQTNNFSYTSLNFGLTSGLVTWF